MFVTLSHLISSSSCTACNVYINRHARARLRANTHTILPHNWRVMSVVFQSLFLFLEVLWTTSQCALLLSFRSQFSHDPFMNTSSCKAFFSTSGYFCSIMHGGGIKTVDVMASPFQRHVQALGDQWCASVARNRAPRLATHTSRGAGCMCEEHGIKRGTSVATGLWRPGTMVAPGQSWSPGPCRKG